MLLGIGFFACGRANSAVVIIFKLPWFPPEHPGWRAKE
jgi:hypothetical protein